MTQQLNYTVQSSLKLIEAYFEKWLSGDLVRPARPEITRS